MEFGSDSRSVHPKSFRDRRLTKLPNEEGSSLTAVNDKSMWAKVCAGSVISGKVLSPEQPLKSSFLNFKLKMLLGKV